MADFQGTIPSNASKDTGELFKALLDFNFRGVSFPSTTFTLELRQDLAIHKFADKDGAHVEAVGRAPLQITARIPFINGLHKGPNEAWIAPLYPDGWRNFLSACADRTSAPLNHPELGVLTCKVESCKTVWDAQKRGGVEVDVTWIESDDTGVDLATDLADPSPLAGLASAAGDLDAYLGPQDVLGLTPIPYVPPYTFSDLMFAVRGGIDTPTLLQKQFAGRLDNIAFQAQQLENSISGANAALMWPVVQAAERAKASVYSVRQSLLATGSSISLYVTAKDSTIAQIATSLNAPLVEVMQLNAGLMGNPVVPSGSTVRYYKSAA